MSTSGRIVIVGAGLAGCEAAFALREFAFAGPVVLVGREPWPPYQRPPLSKAHLNDEQPRDALWLRAPGLYAENDIELRLGTQVIAVDRPRREVTLGDGTPLGYDRLLLATGGEARRLPVDGAQLSGVHELKSIDDAERLRPQLRDSAAVVVIGGGYVGMEFAASARRRGCEVTVVEAQPAVLSRSLSPVIAAHLSELHASHGVRIRTGASVERLEGTDRVHAVVLTDGTRLPADIALVAIGNVASDELGRAIGLAGARGIVVDRDCRTSDPFIHAAGDCAARHHDGFDAPLRLESVQSATFQARCAAAAMCRPADAPGAPVREEVPWFWSDQFDTKIQMAGLRLPGDTALVRGEPASGRFSVIYRNAARVTAIQCVNAPADFVAGKKMILERRPFPADRLADAGSSLKDIRRQTPHPSSASNHEELT